jgi:hypothetical protein
MQQEVCMSTASALPFKRETTIELKLKGQEITADLRIIELPGGVCDFIVDGTDGYIALFASPNVFGVAFATLKQGSNLLARLNNDGTEAYLISEAGLLKATDGSNVATTPIVIPPKPPKQEIFNVNPANVNIGNVAEFPG